MVTKLLAIEPIKYDGSIADFRGWMDTFFARGGNNLMTSLTEEEIHEVMRKDSDFNSGRSDIVGPFARQLTAFYSTEDKDTNREVWHIAILDPTINPKGFLPNKWATILAIEQPPNNTVVEFLDGVYFQCENKVRNYSRLCTW